MRKCTDEQYAKWGEKTKRSIEFHLSKLADITLSAEKHDFHAGLLAISYRDLGYVYLANQDFKAALESFQASVVRKCEMLERTSQEGDREVSAGDFQTLLIALAVNDNGLVSRFVNHFVHTHGPKDSVYFAGVLKAIMAGDLRSAKQLASQKPPKIDRQFKGYAECLEALVSRDEQLFIKALKQASKYWEAWVARYSPEESVCFIHGVGFLRLAEQIFGHPVGIVDENIPAELLK